jgi:hypothetical protein
MSYTKKRSASFIDDSDASTTAPQAPKKSKKTGSASPAGEDDDGNPYWDVREPHTLDIYLCS